MLKRLAQISVILLALGIVCVAGILIYLFALDGLESIINSRLSAMVDDRYHLEARVGEVSGDIWSGIVLDNVEVRYVDSLRSYLMADIPRVTTGYAISNLWNRNFLLKYLFVDSARVTLVRDSLGDWLLPQVPVSSDSSQVSSPDFAVEMLSLNDASLRIIDKNDTLEVERINLVLELKSSGGTYGVKVNQFEFGSDDSLLHLDAFSGKLTYGGGQLMFENLLLQSDKTHLKLNGNLTTADPISALIDFDINNADLEKLSSFTKRRLKGVLDLNGQVRLKNGGVSGSVNLGGELRPASFENLHADFRYRDKRLYFDSLYGTILGTCSVDGSGEIDFSVSPQQYRLTADIRDFNLKELVKNAYLSSLNGRIDLRGESFRKEELILRIETELFDSEFHEYHFHRADGELVVTRDSLVFGQGFQFDYFENRLELAGRVEYKDSIDLKVEADLPNLERYQGKLFIARPAGRAQAKATLRGRTADPDLQGSFESDSLWLYGFFSRDFLADFDIGEFLHGRDGFVEVHSYDGESYSLPYDTCYGHLSLDSQQVELDSVYLHNSYSSITTGGHLDYGDYPMRLDLDTLSLQVFEVAYHNRLALQIGIDSTGFEFRQTAIADSGSVIAVRGYAGYDESLQLTVFAEEVPAGPWISLFDEELPFEGRLSCEVEVGGNLNRPQLDLRATMDSLIYRQLVLGDLAVDAQYRNGRLDIDSITILSNPGRYRADGYLHMNLAFTSEATERFPDRPMDIHFTATDSRFDLVSLMLPSVEQLDGDFAADFSLSGTPDAPNLEGEAFLTAASLKYFDLEDTLYTDSAGVTMHNDVIAIELIEAHGPDDDQPVFLNGEIQVKSLDNLYYDVDVSIPKPFPLSYELDDITGKAKALLHVGGDSPPRVTGNVELVSMKYLVNFAEESEGSPIMAALAMENSWDLDLNIDIPSNYWIKNEDIDAELSGQLNLVRDNGVYRFIGEMEFVRGSGFLFDKKLHIDQGSKVIFEGNEELNPQLDIVGRTRIMGESQSPIDGEEATREEIELCVQVIGTLDTPEINPCAESQLTREEIIPLLVANYYTSDSVTATGRLEQSISGLVGTEISKIGSRSLNRLGVETFVIDPYYQGQFDPLKARVTVGFYTARNLYVYGSSALSFESLQEVGFDYRFNKNMLLEGRSDEDLLYRLALKLHWEF
ncbi:MAG: translocation/assembly module TamB domain-containing protein [candidate division Zixibacteria bacterium]|nr:translocation/assembly module TamB domain-containing protein [candidate division Zixibacteria bacterium]MDH3937160.1 translocation/assembly module TamB domain-containing protein [candidate division Zixibacteria bacterium]MDH4035034.1 translocation/assembly module TamB domain-containing protein [candidate division Zixibacteria bacterium]